MGKRLYRSRRNRMIWGVCGGLAEYFDMDPNIIRVITVLLIFANGLGILAYIILALVVPLEDSKASAPQDVIKENVAEIKDTVGKVGRETQATWSGEGDKSEAMAKTHRYRRNALGIIFIALGILFLLGNFNLFWWFQWGRFWPLALVAVGLLIIVGTRRK